MMTLNDLTNMMWYVQEIMIFETFPVGSDPEELRKAAMLVCDNSELRSDTHKDIRNRYIQSFGAIDDFVIVTLKK